MIKILVALIMALAVSPSSAGESKDWKGYYNNLLTGLKSKVEKKMESKNRVSAVAAVRGAKQGSDAGALYWKGGVSEKARKKQAEEKKALTEAVQLVVDGKPSEGRAALEKFIKDRPDSFYLPDAKEALSNLPAEEAQPAETKDAGGKTGADPAQEKPAAD